MLILVRKKNLLEGGFTMATKRKDTMQCLKESIETMEYYASINDVEMAECFKGSAETFIHMMVVFRGITREDIFSQLGIEDYNLVSA